MQVACEVARCGGLSLSKYEKMIDINKCSKCSQYPGYNEYVKKTINKILKETTTGYIPKPTNIGNKIIPPPKPTIIDIIPTIKTNKDKNKICFIE